MRRQVEALDQRHSEEFPEQVRSVLRTALPTQRASADQVAALFSRHRRTLTSRLTACGTSFTALLDEGRLDVAIRLLWDTSLDVNQIAATLDYADASAFTRAFRRWTGTTPTARRESQVTAGCGAGRHA